MNRQERRAKLKLDKKPSQDTSPHVARAAHVRRVNFYRSRTMQVIRDVRAGKVDEEELDKLQNFIQMSCAYMMRGQPGSIERAIADAELVDLLKYEDCDADVVWDKDKLQDK